MLFSKMLKRNVREKIKEHNPPIHSQIICLCSKITHKNITQKNAAYIFCCVKIFLKNPVTFHNLQYFRSEVKSQRDSVKEKHKPE
jgi:queuine/archaeosine tRNA-ribosyltransferase